MAIGLSTYAFFWRASDKISSPLSIENMIEQTADLGGKVFQICDYNKIETFSNKELEQIRQLASSYNIELELGTKGIEPIHLDKYLHIAEVLNVSIFRTMFNSPTFRPNNQEIKVILSEYLEKFAAINCKIGIETYEQIKTKDMVAIIKEINHPFLGICLDPANCIAALENPIDVIDTTADFVINLHIKDFTFSRRDGWVGFNLTGTSLGEGLLDYQYMLQKIQPASKGINQVIELWLPWQENEKQTCETEKLWAEQSFRRLIDN